MPDVMGKCFDQTAHAKADQIFLLGPYVKMLILL